MEYYSTIKRDEIMPFVGTWMDLETVIQSEVSQKEKHQYSILTHAAKSLQSCPTLCDPIDGSPPGSSVPVILQAIILDWVAIAFSNA